MGGRAADRLRDAAFPGCSTGPWPGSERRGLAHTLIGVTGDFVPAREVLNPLFLARMMSVSAADVDPAQFRQLLGRFATGVAIVTVRGARRRSRWA